MDDKAKAYRDEESKKWRHLSWSWGFDAGYAYAKSEDEERIKELQAQLEDINSIDHVAHAKYMEDKYVRAACEIAEYEQQVDRLQKQNEILREGLDSCMWVDAGRGACTSIARRTLARADELEGK